MKKCQRCGKEMENPDPNINFCNNCQDDLKKEDELWDEFFNNIEKRQKNS